MTSIEDLASTADGPEIVLARDAAGLRFVVVSADLKDADEITAEGQFPQFGQFLQCEVEGDECLIECPGGLAKEIVEAAAEKGNEITSLQFEISEVSHTANGFRFRIAYEALTDR